MTAEQSIFSKRYGLRASPEGLISDNVPDTARVGLCYIIVEMLGYANFPSISILLWDVSKALRILPTEQLQNRMMREDYLEIFNNVIMKCNWWQFYDACEVIYISIGRKTPKVKFTDRVNTLFKDEGLGFELRDGKVEKLGTGFIDAQIKEVRYLLKEPEFKSADKQFEKAIKALNSRPQPDTENCIKDAINAIESVAKVLTNKPKALLDDIIRDLSKAGVIPKPLDDIYQKLYGYRGNEPGVAHGSIELSKVTLADAEFVLAISAASIIYLVNKRNDINASKTL